MVCVGESETLPDACVLFVTVRVVPPALAVIVTDEAFVVCHVSVTLCPLLIAVLLAENVRVGEPDPGLPIPCDPQPMNVVRAISAVITKQEGRMQRDFIELKPRPKNIVADWDSKLQAGVAPDNKQPLAETAFSLVLRGKEGLSLLKLKYDEKMERVRLGISPKDIGRIGIAC